MPFSSGKFKYPRSFQIKFDQVDIRELISQQENVVAYDVANTARPSHVTFIEPGWRPRDEC